MRLFAALTGAFIMARRSLARALYRAAWTVRRSEILEGFFLKARGKGSSVVRSGARGRLVPSRRVVRIRWGIAPFAAHAANWRGAAGLLAGSPGLRPAQSVRRVRVGKGRPRDVPTSQGAGKALATNALSLAGEARLAQARYNER